MALAHTPTPAPLPEVYHRCYIDDMNEVTIRDLRNHGGEVVDRVAAGETMTVTRDGKPVAELRPLARPPLSAQALLDRWSHVPQVSPVKLREDIDDLLDTSL